MWRRLNQTWRGATFAAGGVLCASSGDAAAQVPRIAPPPPCRVPVSSDALLSLQTTRATGGPVLVVFPFTQGVIERRHAHVPWTLAKRVRDRLRLVPALQVVSTGQTARATFESGGAADSAMRLLNASWAILGELEPEGLNTRIQMRLQGPDGQVTLQGSYVLPRYSSAAIEDAIVTSVMKSLAPKSRIPAASARVADALLDLDLAGAGRLMEGYTPNAADSARVLLEQVFQRDTAPVVANMLARASVLVLDRSGEVNSASALRRVDGLLEYVLATSPSDPYAWTTRAIAARVRDPMTYGGAEAAHRRAVAVKPTADSEYEYAVTLLRLGRVDEARARSRRALSLDQSSAQSLALLAAAEYGLGHMELVCAYANASIAADPFNPAPYGVRALARARLLQTREAYADVETALKIEPSVWAKALRLSLEVESRNVADAQEMARALIREVLAQPGTLGVDDALAMARGLVATGFTREAVQVLRKASPQGVALRTGLRDPAFADVLRDEGIQELLKPPRPAPTP